MTNQPDFDKGLVVLDWGWALALPRTRNSLPDGINYLIPEHFLFEPADSQDRRARLVKLHRLLEANPRRLFVGCHWNHLVDKEPLPGDFVDRRDVVAMELPRAVSDVEEWITRIDEDSSPLDAFRFRKSHFDSFRVDVAKGLEANARELYKTSLADQDWAAFIRDPAAAVDVAIHQFPQCETEEWRSALTTFPDRHAIGRISRLWLWYTLRCTNISPSTRRGREKLRNDWEDLHYAFLASYADEFWTRDHELAEAVRLLFPGTKVVTPSPPS